jgi:hypothetical protein
MDTKNPPEQPDPKNPLVACTVLVAKTTYGDVILGQGAKIRIPKKDAETLAGLNPPAVEITGL